MTNVVSADPNVASSDPNVELLDAEKFKGVDLNKSRKIEVLSEEQLEADRIEAEEIKRISDEKLKERVENDVVTIKELADILGNDELASKAGPVTEIPLEDIKYIMDAMVDTLENDSIELPEDMRYKLDSYIFNHGPYVGSDKAKEYTEKNTEGDKISVRASYDRTSAVDYAFKWVHSYNTTYYPNLNAPSIGGDCTNFVSQAIFAGGYAQRDNWWINKLNSIYLEPKTSTEYRVSWSSTWPGESAWIYAPAFAKYWQPKVLTGEYNASFVADSPQVPYQAPYYLGDIVQVMTPITNNGTIVGYNPFHSTIITNYSPENQDYRVSYHSGPVKDKLLASFANSYRSYRLRFYRMGDPR